MHHFSVWAPQRKKVSVQVDGTEYPMAGPSERGFWKADVEAAVHGSDYGFLLDDDPKPYPDPRSFWQPKDVHSHSRVLDHGKFAWTDEKFRPSPLPSAIIYEMHLGTFTEGGTFDSAIEKLDYLYDLGITHIELLPVASYEGSFSWGYDGVSPYAPDESYGGPEAVKRFVNACHEKGLGVILDVVYNHFGPAGNYTQMFGPYFTERHHTPWGAAINFEEGGSDQVRRYFIDNALMWLREYHFDGLRLDAVHELIDRSAMHFLEQLSLEVEDLSAALGRELFLIGETDLNDPKFVTPREANGFGLDAQWSDDFHHALFTLIHHEQSGYYQDFGTVDQLATTLKQVFLYDGRYSRFRQHNHGRQVQKISYHRFLGYIQNHDQIGNRAKGERLEHLVGMQKAKLAAAVVMTAPFLPMIFMGEEWAAATPWMYFADFQDEDLRKNVRDGRKRDFQHFGWSEDVPNPEDPATVEASKLKWSELEDPKHDEMFRWYRDLIHLRRRTLALNLGDFSRMVVHHSEEDRWIYTDRGNIRTMINLSENETPFAVEPGSELLLSSDVAPSREGDCVMVPPLSVAIYHWPPQPLDQDPPA
ncbi:malto-oligosyltrehalose trehalohydrolase [Terriglobus roseus DSM 18391]|uniref:Malto-oligosyltrehalose trehalohydrolase n=1 Tax=Terriglobus roseus (strain DSM 18391 / NRRL B-41598 / KBS 63) TaxID=926566 RepID=I3ZD66_TERRK|nr:malto-oligosyltrehalose trehalohydrolase [Terriglobus roseus]AFL87184.1 malto-oligosyltrehalose trehalohydrolase [Terriglobus roseus DSM 18391]